MRTKDGTCARTRVDEESRYIAYNELLESVVTSYNMNLSHGEKHGRYSKNVSLSFFEEKMSAYLYVIGNGEDAYT